ncbi:MAG: Aminotransferase class-III, partial [Actinomycetota bacterium]
MSTHSDAMHAPAGLDHCPFMPTYGAPAVRMVKGEGCRLWDEDGNEYLD